MHPLLSQLKATGLRERTGLLYAVSGLKDYLVCLIGAYYILSHLTLVFHLSFTSNPAICIQLFEKGEPLFKFIFYNLLATMSIN